MAAGPANSSSSRVSNAAVKSRFRSLRDAAAPPRPGSVAPPPRVPAKAAMGQELWLWKLKEERPELFQRPRGHEKEVDDCPAGFAEHSEGWYWSQAEELFWHRTSKAYFAHDAASGAPYEVIEGLCHREEVAMWAAGTCAADAAGRHVIIQDLHKAAQALQRRFRHFDRPSAMLAVLDGAGGTTAAAKQLPGALLWRLGSYRGAWPERKLLGALAETVEEVLRGCREESQAAQGAGAGSLSVALALLLGRRLWVATSPGARCLVASGQEAASRRVLAVRSEDGGVATRCFDGSSEFQYLALLGSSCPSSALSDADVSELFVGHSERRRPHAAAAAVIAAARRRGRGGAQAIVASARWTQQREEPLPAPPAPKRPKTEARSSIRVRQILLLHVGGKAQLDPVRRKAVTRAKEEAEALLVTVIDALQGERCLGGKFTERCREVSECPSSLKGGDFAGDIGWITRQEQKQPAAVVRAAFDLDVGQLSDIVASDRGVHLLLRTA